MEQNQDTTNLWYDTINTVIKIISIVTKKDIDIIYNHIQESPSIRMGDISCKICFEIARDSVHNARDIAKNMINDITELIKEYDMISHVEASNGYLNFFIERETYTKKLLQLITDDKYVNIGILSGKRSLIEYPAVNPCKPWHIGHARNAVIGDTLSNVLEYAGCDVVRMDYINDLGDQIAQVTWKLMDCDIEKNKKYDHALGELYASIQNEILEHKDTIAEVSINLEDRESKESVLSRKIVDRCIQSQQMTGKRLNIEHDFLFYESSLAHEGLLTEVKKRILDTDNIFLMNDGDKKGCIVLDLKAFDEFKNSSSDYAVLFGSDGTRTYIGGDVALQMFKMGIIGNKPVGEFDLTFNVIASEQAFPQSVVHKSIKSLGYDDNNIHHITYGRVKGNSGTLSGRLGSWIGSSCDDVLDKACEMVLSIISERNNDFTTTDIREIAEKIGSGAVRYFLLNYSLDREITFDWDKILDFSGDSGPYIQYSLVRAKKILDNADYNNKYQIDSSCILSDVEFELILHMSKIRSKIDDIILSMNKTSNGTRIPLNHMTTYTMRLASLFTSFYDKCRVIIDDINVQNARLSIVSKFIDIMSDCMNILGISIVEQM